MTQTVYYHLNAEAATRRYGYVPDNHPRAVYLFITDDGKIRTYHIGGKTDARLRIFQNMDELAPLLESMTLFNTYVLGKDKDSPSQCPWTYWNDKGNKQKLIDSQRYSLKYISLKESQKMRRDDAWIHTAGLVMKDHYFNRLKLFHPSRDWESRKASRKARKKIKLPF